MCPSSFVDAGDSVISDLAWWERAHIHALVTPRVQLGSIPEAAIPHSSYHAFRFKIITRSSSQQNNFTAKTYHITALTSQVSIRALHSYCQSTNQPVAV